jgi:hypothetical protein
MGVYKALLLRDSGGRLIGYSSFFVQAPLRSTATIWAINDVLYVTPEHRGTAGIALVERSERDLKEQWRAANLIYPGVDDTLAQLLTACGYRDVGRVMSKVL